MTARVQINRFNTTGQRPSSSRPVGEIYANYADNQFGVIDYTPGVRDLLAIRYHSDAGAYTTGDYVLAGTGASAAIYKATIGVTPGPFSSASWDPLPTLSQTDARYLKLTGGNVVTGPVTFTNTVTLAADPTLPLQAATKQYVDTRVLRSGDIMTGFLTLHADPVNPLHAATKQSVDTAISSSNLFLRLTGGTLTGALTVGGNGVRYTNLTPADQHFVSFGWAGVLYGVVNGTYVGQIATRDFVSGAYLPLTGGNLTGTLYTAGELQAVATVRLTNSQAYFHSNASETILQMDGGGWTLRYARASGYLWYRRGSDGLSLFAVDGSGNTNAGGSVQATGHVLALNSVFARGGSVFFGASDRSRLVSDNSTYTALQVLDNHRFQFDWANGHWRVINSGEVTTLNLDGAGSLAVVGNMSAGVSMFAGSTVRAGASVQAVDGAMVMGGGGAGRILQMSPSWYWDWNSGTGTLIWNRPGGYFWVMDTTISFCYNNQGSVGGYGSYVTLSDERTKTHIKPLDLGLQAILDITPISFTRARNGKADAGFSAQNVQHVIPQAVNAFGYDLPDDDDPDSTSPALGVSLDPIVAAMLNGMKELAARVTQLESKQA